MNKSKRKIKANDLVIDIKAGLSDPQLMNRYDINSRQLEYLLHQLVDKGVVSQSQIEARAKLADTSITRAYVETSQSIQELDDGPEPTAYPDQPHHKPPQAKGKITVKAGDIVRDLRAGLSDPEIVAKYGMTDRQLEFIFSKLVDSGRIGVEEFYNRATSSPSPSHSSITRAFVDVYQSLQELED